MLITNKFQYNLIFQSQTGNKTNVTINTGLSAIIVTDQAAFTMRILTLTSAVDNLSGLQVSNLSKVFINNCTVILPTQTTINNYYYISINEKAELKLDNLEFNTALDNTKIKVPFYVSSFASLRADDCKFNNFSTICINDAGSSSYFGNIKFNNIYSTVFVAANNSSLYVSGDNNFDGENSPTGYENTVDYGIDGAVFYASVNSDIAAVNLRVRNTSLYAPNIQYVDSAGSVLNWTGNRVFISSSNSKILSNLCYFENFVIAASIDRNAVLSLYASIYTDLAYVINGYSGQLAYGWSVTAAAIVLDNQFYKNPTITNQLIPGVLLKPFSYDQGGTTMSGWSTTSPQIL